MGRMKELYIQVMEANGGIPYDMTIGDLVKMQKWNEQEWQEYEQEAKKRKLQQSVPTDPREELKNQQALKKFSSYYGIPKEKDEV